MDEIVALSGKERDRLVVLKQVRSGKLKQKQAAQQLGLTVRWVREDAEMLERHRQLRVSREPLRQWMSQAWLWRQQRG